MVGKSFGGIGGKWEGMLRDVVPYANDSLCIVPSRIKIFSYRTTGRTVQTTPIHLHITTHRPTHPCGHTVVVKPKNQL